MSAPATTAGDVLVTFGITGDLAKKMTFRSLYRLERRRKLQCPIIGVARDEWSAATLRDHARRAVGYVKRKQRVDEPDLTIRGAVAGSAPIWGRYSMFEFPNWAAKFFADALMMEITDSAIPPIARVSAAGMARAADA